MIAAIVKKRLDVPDQPGDWFEIRKLGWRKLREAADVASREGYASVKILGKDGVEAIKAVTAEQIDALKQDPVQRLDWGVLLRAGVTAWSQGEKLPTPDELDDLDADLAEWLVREIYALAKPPRDEATAKND